MNQPVHEVYAIRYATVDRKARDNFLGPVGADLHEAPMQLDFYVWLIRGAEATILVDTGFSAASAAERKRQYLCPPVEALQRLGVAPGAVDHVILTHFHYDHAGNTDQFPNARFHVQDREMAFATGRHMGYPALNHFFAVADVQTLVGHVYDSRVTFHDGQGTVADGVTVHRVGGHTDGLQVVRVRTARGHVVLASDAAHYYRNKLESNPFPAIFNVGDMLEGWRAVDRLADSPDHVVPGHDPAVRELYPALELAGVDVSILHEPPRLPSLSLGQSNG